MGKNHEPGTAHAKVLGWEQHWGGQDSGSREGVGEWGQEKAGAGSELGQVLGLRGHCVHANTI